MRVRVFAGLLLAGAASAWRPALAATPPDSVAAPPAARPAPWYRPRHVMAQVAGGMGMVAGGAGYQLFRNRVEADLLLGYVPQRFAGSTLTVGTAKALYSPFQIGLSPKVQLLPLTLGAYVSYTHGILNSGAPGQYPADYYWFSATTRYGPLLGSRLTYLGAPVKATGQPRKLSLYYELGSNDLYLASYFTNILFDSLTIKDILTLGLGVKVDF